MKLGKIFPVWDVLFEYSTVQAILMVLLIAWLAWFDLPEIVAYAEKG